MKSIITTFTGGFPLNQSDLQFLQDRDEVIIRAFLNAINAASTAPVILSGCVRNVSSNTSITQGYIAWNGRVYHVPAHSYTNATGSEFEYFELQQLFEASGSKNFETSGAHEVHEHVIAQVVKGSSVPSGNVVITLVPRVEANLRTKLNIAQWIDFANNDDDAYYGPGQTPAATYRRFLKDIDGFVHLTGQKIFDDIQTPTDVLIARLPVGFRPPFTISHVYVDRQSNTSANFIRVEIGDEGNIIARQATGFFSMDLKRFPPFRVA